MSSDDVALALGELEILRCAFERRRGMREAVQPMRGVRVVPVVEEVVMKQRAANERGAIDADAHALEEGGEGGARACDRADMLVDAYVSVLDEVAREAESARLLERSGDELDLVRRRLLRRPSIIVHAHPGPPSLKARRLSIDGFGAVESQPTASGALRRARLHDGTQ